ncbi:MAG: hypothetical protein HKN60_08080, partial [Rhizobiales bacterium]|nr:hypothetical protein [Hyphomicrobiales bacterium]
MTEPQPKPVASQPVDDDNHNQLDDSENAASAELSGPQGAQGTQGTQGEPAPEAGPETGQAAAAHGQSDAPGPSPELNCPELGRPELGRDSSDQLSASQSDDDFPDDLGGDTADDAAPLGNGPRL